MDNYAWKVFLEELAVAGWTVAWERKFRPMFGAYIDVRAVHAPTGRTIRVEAPNLRIAVKKLKARLPGGEE